MFYVVSRRNDDEWTHGKFETEEDAVRSARELYEQWTDGDRKKNTLEVREYEADIEDENCTDFSYDTIEWRLKYYVTDFHSGIIDGVTPHDTLDAAREFKEELLDGEEDTGLWIIVDSDGNEY